MALEVLFLLALGVVAIVAGLVGPFHRSATSESERPVLPSHYSSLFYTDPARYPGYCTDCATDDEPGYRFCEDCGTQIPPSKDPFGSDVRQIFEEQGRRRPVLLAISGGLTLARPSSEICEPWMRPGWGSAATIRRGSWAS